MRGSTSKEELSTISRRDLLKAGVALAGVTAVPNLFTLASATAGTAVGTLRTISEWEQAVLEFWDVPGSFGNEHYLQRSLSGDSYRQYWLGYGVDAVTALAQATGDADWLNCGLTYAQNLMDTAVLSSSLPNSQYKDGYLAWPSGRTGYIGMEIPLDESICWRSVARMLKVIRDTPAWYNDTAVRNGTT
jgi:hypothetical protein